MQRRNLLSLVACAAPLNALALYDPKPNNGLALAAGAWVGLLTYRDWSSPEKLVTLPCKAFISLTAPTELALFYVFDDGPAKTVYSYERMSFDFAANRLVWASGISKPSTSSYLIIASSADVDRTRVVFERTDDGRRDVYTLDVGVRSTTLEKVEVAASGTQTFRNKYELRRSEA